MNKQTKIELLQQCKELGIPCASSTKKQDILLLIQQHESKSNDILKPRIMGYDYIPYDDDDIDYLYERHFDDIMTDEVDWTMFSKELLDIMDHDGKNYMKLATIMAHSLRTQWNYYRQKNTDSEDVAKLKHVYLKLVYKYIYDHKLCLDNFF